MQLIIKNFGPIKHGEIDLTKKFYLLVGYNNTGKTYISQLLWSIFNEQTIKNFSQNVNIPEFNQKNNSFEITPIILDKILEEFAQFLKHQIVPKIFNIDKHHFILDQFSLHFKYDINIISTYKSISSFPGDHVFTTFSKEKDSLTVKLTQESVKLNKNLVLNAINLPISSMYNEFIVNLLFNTHHYHQATFLPSSRLFYPLFYSYVYRLQKEKYEKEAKLAAKLIEEMVEKAKKGEEFDLESSLINGFESDYTEPMNVLFDKLYQLNEEMTAQNHYQDLIEDLTKILGGNIFISKREGIAPIKFGFKPTKHKNHLPMFLSSSAVNQLSTLYLYLKYWVNKEYNFLMIDEPEENLHPKNQIALLHILLAFAQVNNNKVLITSHSPLLGDVINNYLYLFWLKSQNIDVNTILGEYSSEINTNINLSTEDIAIYFFEGQKIIPYKRGDYGVVFSDFNSEQRKIKKIELALTNKMYELLNDDEEY